MRKIWTASALVAVAAAACAGPSARDVADQRALAEARPVGEPQSCVQLVGIRNTRVLDNRMIDFIMRNGDVYRNRLPDECPGLGFDESFSYRTSQSQLCSVDIITVRNRSGLPGASCGLGQFQRVELPR